MLAFRFPILDAGNQLSQSPVQQTMSALHIAIAALIASGALLLSLAKSDKTRRWGTCGVAFLVALSAFVDIAADRQHSKAEAQQRAVQNEMADAVKELRANSDQERMQANRELRETDRPRRTCRF
jgi:hypothetical protein